MSKNPKPPSHEDEYFRKLDMERLEDIRRQKALAENVRHCPDHRCEQIALVIETVRAVEIERCPNCGGVWLDQGELEVLTAREEQEENSLGKFFRSLVGNS